MEIWITKEKMTDYVKTANELDVLCKKYVDVYLYEWMTYCGWSIQDNNVIIKFTLDYFDETELDSITIPIDEFLEKCKEL